MSYVLKFKPIVKPQVEYRGTPPQFGMTDEMVHFIHHYSPPQTSRETSLVLCQRLKLG